MSTTSERGLPPYARVVADLRARIEKGELAPGDRVPSTREITREWGVAMATATKALSALRQEGLVEAVRGVGTVVRREVTLGAVVAQVPDARVSTTSPVSATQTSTTRVPVDPSSASSGAEQRPSGAASGGRRRVPEAVLNREAVVRAAIAVADEEGLGGLSMRRVATDLRVSTMALYRHVDNKDELLRAMVDEVYSEVELPGPVPEDWRQACELSQRREWSLYRSHPWLVHLGTVTRPVLSARLLEYGEWIMNLLTEHGCSPNDALKVITVLTAYMSGMALQVEQVTETEREKGMDSQQFWAATGAELAAEDRVGERYPNMFQVSAPPDFDIDGTFEFGLAHLLDGLESLVDQGKRPGR